MSVKPEYQPTMKKILVPIDFTAATEHALAQALILAGQAKAAVTLFHVLEQSSPDITGDLNRHAEEVRAATGIACTGKAAIGPLFDTIAGELGEEEYDLAVIGTHGARGVFQKWFGADILKLVARIPVPVLVVQENSPRVETFRKIVVPVGSHHSFSRAVDGALLFASLFPDLEVHLYSIHKPGFDWPEALSQNVLDAARVFGEKGIRMVRVREEQDDSSPGFARQTLRYAASAGADAIFVMSVASEEYYYMSKVYKETILLNESGIPVVCTGGSAGR